MTPNTQRYFVFELGTTYDSARLFLTEQGGSQFEAVGAISALMSISPPPSLGAYYATAGERDPMRFWRVDDDGPKEVNWKFRMTLRRHHSGHPTQESRPQPPPAQPADELARRRSTQ